MLGISENKLKHCIGVARCMEQLARERGWSEEKCREMFLLGYVHDLGYEFASEQDEHPYIGGQLLQSHMYPYWQEVANHGSLDCKYTSEELDLLNTADLMVDACGRNVGIEGRLNDIAQRYGYDSKQHLNSRVLARRLGLMND